MHWSPFTRLLALLLVLAAGAAGAQPRDGVGPIERTVFSPALVMANRRAIGFTEEQKRELIREMTQAQADLLPLQLEMTEARADLLELLEGARVDEEAALAVVERVMELEKRTKRRHMTLLIRIKNLLSAEQQARLEAIRGHG